MRAVIRNQTNISEAMAECAYTNFKIRVGPYPMGLGGGSTSCSEQKVNIFVPQQKFKEKWGKDKRGEHNF